MDKCKKCGCYRNRMWEGYCADCLSEGLEWILSHYRTIKAKKVVEGEVVFLFGAWWVKAQDGVKSPSTWLERFAGKKIRVTMEEIE